MCVCGWMGICIYIQIEFHIPHHDITHYYLSCNDSYYA